MDTKPTAVFDTPGSPLAHEDTVPGAPGQTMRRIRDRMFEGLLFVLPIALTFWVIRWLYSSLEYNVIDPIAQVLLWKIRWSRSSTELPYWFETFVAPLLAILIVLLLVYCLGFFVHSRLRRSIDWVLLRIPVISLIYDSLRGMVKSLEKPKGQPRPQKMVLVEFPHPGIKVPAFLTAKCRDIDTQKVLVCVYVPTTPFPTSGYFLIVPEERVTELNWSLEETLQTIMSGGLTAPPEVHYFQSGPAADLKSDAGQAMSEVPPPPGGR